MLLRILSLIQEKGNFSTNFISKELGLPAALVDDMKNKLISSGYIEKDSCDTSMCEKCSCGCNTKMLNDKIEWKITEMGHKVWKKMEG